MQCGLASVWAKQNLHRSSHFSFNGLVNCQFMVLSLYFNLAGNNFNQLICQPNIHNASILKNINLWFIFPTESSISFYKPNDSHIFPTKEKMSNKRQRNLHIDY
jgi:hypothetical protein